MFGKKEEKSNDVSIKQIEDAIADLKVMEQEVIHQKEAALKQLTELLNRQYTDETVEIGLKYDNSIAKFANIINILKMSLNSAPATPIKEELKDDHLLNLPPKKKFEDKIIFTEEEHFVKEAK